LIMCSTFLASFLVLPLLAATATAAVDPEEDLLGKALHNGGLKSLEVTKNSTDAIGRALFGPVGDFVGDFVTCANDRDILQCLGDCISGGCLGWGECEVTSNSCTTEKCEENCGFNRDVAGEPVVIDLTVVYNEDVCNDNEFGGRKQNADNFVKGLVSFSNFQHYHPIGIHLRLKSILGNCENGVQEINNLCASQECRNVDINLLGNGRQDNDSGESLQALGRWWRGLKNGYKRNTDVVVMLLPYTIANEGNGVADINGLCQEKGLADDAGHYAIVNIRQNGEINLSKTTKLFSHEVGHVLGAEDLYENDDNSDDCSLMGYEILDCWNTKSLNEIEEVLNGTKKECLAERGNTDYFIGLKLLYPEIWSNYVYYYDYITLSESQARAYFEFPGIMEDHAPIPAFNPIYYYNNYIDLRKDQYNPSELLKHWLLNGINEGRAASAAFDPKYYLSKYQDLRDKFGSDNYYKAVQHWLNNGIKEGRRGSYSFKPESGTNYEAALRSWLLSRNNGGGLLGSFEVINQGVGSFGSLTATSNVETIVGDFTGDGLTDIVLLKKTAGWNSIPMAIAMGEGVAGNWKIINRSHSTFTSWAATSNVETIVGDFDGDGRTDIALVNKSGGWSTIPIAFSMGNGNFRITNQSVGSFARWAATSDVEIIVGDFDGDGRTDIALVRKSEGWSTIPIAFSKGNGNFQITNRPHSLFTSLATTSNVETIVGDFDGDGRTDIALVRKSGGWSTIPVAFSMGNGNFETTNLPDSIFPPLAATSNVETIVGDFNGDGKTDIALLRKSKGWSTIPVAFSLGHGGFVVANRPNSIFTKWATIDSSNVETIVGDFNGDGKTDIALLRKSRGRKNRKNIRTAFSMGNGYFDITKQPHEEFASLAQTSDVETITGDFNGDGRTDIALVRKGSGGWSSIPVALGKE